MQKLFAISVLLVSLGMVLSCSKEMAKLGREASGPRQNPNFSLAPTEAKVLLQPDGLILGDQIPLCQRLTNAVTSFHKSHLAGTLMSSLEPCRTVGEQVEAVYEYKRHEDALILLFRASKRIVVDPNGDEIRSYVEVNTFQRSKGENATWQKWVPSDHHLFHINFSHIQVSLASWLKNEANIMSPWLCQIWGRDFDPERLTCFLETAEAQNLNEEELPAGLLLKTPFIQRKDYIAELLKNVVQQLTVDHQEKWQVSFHVADEIKRLEGQEVDAADENLQGAGIYISQIQVSRKSPLEIGETGMKMPPPLQLAWRLVVSNEKGDDGPLISESTIFVQRDGSYLEWETNILEQGIFHPQLVHLGKTLAKYASYIEDDES